MAHPSWPLFDLRVRTPRLEIRLPSDDDLGRLVTLADEGIHDAGTMPFTTPWTDVPSPRRQRESLQWWWGRRAAWQPDGWSFTGAVFVDGNPAGVQDMAARSFARLRTVTTGSWLGQAHQGKGIGKEMRAAILHLAFEGLGAREAYSGGFHDNAASLGVSRALGYEDNGTQLVLRRGAPDRVRNLRLDRGTWAASRRYDIVIEGLEGCRDMFGVLDPTGVRVRRAAPGESDEVASLWLRARAASVPSIPPPVHTEAEVRAWFRDAVFTSQEVWVADLDDRVVGLSVLGDGSVEQLYVEPTLTNWGIGTLLLGAAKARRPAGLELWTFVANAGARRFYERHGFSAVEQATGHSEEGAPDVRYRWPGDATTSR